MGVVDLGVFMPRSLSKVVLGKYTLEAFLFLCW